MVNNEVQAQDKIQRFWRAQLFHVAGKLLFTKVSCNLVLAASHSLNLERWCKILTWGCSEWECSADLFFVQYFITAALGAVVQNRAALQQKRRIQLNRTSEVYSSSVEKAWNFGLCYRGVRWFQNFCFCTQVLSVFCFLEQLIAVFVPVLQCFECVPPCLLSIVRESSTVNKTKN